MPIVNGAPRPLLQLSGRVRGDGPALEMDQLSFGQAALNTRVMRRLMLQNLGDMPSTFRLDGKMVAPDFTITPLEGYLQPNEDVNLEVTALPPAALARHPVRAHPAAAWSTASRRSADAHGRVRRGRGRGQHAVAFKTRVRQPAKRRDGEEPGTALWRITPIGLRRELVGARRARDPRRRLGAVRGDLPAADDDEAGGGGRRGGEARGSVFFPLPDGSAILHTLEGEAQPPQAGAHDRRVGGGEGAEDALPQAAQLAAARRSASAWTSARPTRRRRRCCTGHAYVDVPAGLTREYALKFYSYKEGVTNAEVHFINERTDEYLYYKLELKAEAPGTLQTIELQAPLRQLCQRALPLVNPLDTEVSFTAAANNAEVVVPATLVVPANGRPSCRSSGGRCCRRTRRRR